MLDWSKKAKDTSSKNDLQEMEFMTKHKDGYYEMEEGELDPKERLKRRHTTIML